MPQDDNNVSRVPTLAELYPELRPDELAEAEESVRRYVAVVARIADRLHSEADGCRQQPPQSI